MFVTPSKVEKLLQLYWEGDLVKPLPTLAESRENLKINLRTIRSDITRSLNPTPFKVSLSSHLYDLMITLWESEVPVQEFN